MNERARPDHLRGEYCGCINSLYILSVTKANGLSVSPVVGDKARMMRWNGSYHLWWDFKNSKARRHQEFPTREAMLFAAEMLANNMKAKGQ